MTDIDEARAIFFSAYGNSGYGKNSILNFLKKFHILGFHGVVLMKTIPLMSRMQNLAQVSQPRGRHFYQKRHIYNPGGTILTKNVLFPIQGAGF